MLELTGRQRLTVERETKNRVNFGWSLKEEKMWVKLSVLSNLTQVTYRSPNESPDQGEEERSQMIGLSTRSEVGAPSVSRSKEEESQLLDRGRGERT